MQKKKKHRKTVWRRINDWLHLWLGLVSGIVVFVVSLTGCMYAFQQEIKDSMEPWRFVEAQQEPFVPPGQLLDTARKYIPEKKPTGLTYSNKEGAAAVGFFSMENGQRSFSVVFMNPYSGAYITQQTTIGDGSFDFFRFIIDGHRALWLPYDIGRPIVGVCTLVFVILLITGIIMWWPEKWNRTHFKKSFTIRWRGSFKRVNYDLHNVLGFYSLIFALIIALTGLVWSFQWVEKGIYFVLSGGAGQTGHAEAHSVTLPDTLRVTSPLDLAWYQVMALDNRVEGVYIEPSPGPEEAIEVMVYHQPGSFYDRNAYYFDQYSMELIRMPGDRFEEANLAEQVSMLNYDMHIGAVWGLPGKILAFFISLVCTSLPVTGFLVWWNKRSKKAGRSQRQQDR